MATVMLFGKKVESDERFIKATDAFVVEDQTTIDLFEWLLKVLGTKNADTLQILEHALRNQIAALESLRKLLEKM